MARLNLPFHQISPICDENPLEGENPHDLALRLAKIKALSLQNQYPDSLIIGSDQVCALAGQVLGKPGTVVRAVDQLRAMRGKSVDFYTGLCVLNARTGEQRNAVDKTVTTLRNLSDAEIERYVAAEMPLDCAGSFMVEKLGISLFDEVTSADPTALIGLPLISLSQNLRYFGLNVP